jgi:hypothetical protein
LESRQLRGGGGKNGRYGPPRLSLEVATGKTLQ